MTTPVLGTSAASSPVTGVSDPRRLASVAAAELDGHAGDRDLDAVVATLQLGCQVPIAVVNIVRPDLQTYAAEVGVGAPCTNVPDALSFCAEVVDSGAAFVVADARAHPVYGANPLVADGVVGAYAGVPLIDDGVVLGSVAMFDGVARSFTAGELELLTHQAQLASSVLALRRSSRTDALTGLPNRTLFHDQLAQAVARLARRDALIAVMFLDLDGFKLLNDTRGHDAGDQVLAEVARRFSGALRSSDTLARVGGDEFVAVCDDLATPEDAEQVADRLIATVADGLELDGDDVPIAVSVGIAVTGDAAVDVAALMRTADQAMYRAKRLTGSSWVRGSGALAAGLIPDNPVGGSNMSATAVVDGQAGPPQRHRWTRTPHLRGDLRCRQPFGCQQHDPCTLTIAHRNGPCQNAGLQDLPVLLGDVQDLHMVGHASQYLPCTPNRQATCATNH